MRSKRTPKLVREIAKLRAANTPWPDVAARVSKIAGVRVTESACRKWHGEAATKTAPPMPAPTPAATPVQTAPHVEPELAQIALEPVDETPMTSAEFAAYLAGELRGQQRAAKRFTAQGDTISAQRAAKTAASLAGLLSRQQARDEGDGETIRVTLASMRAASDRGLSKLRTYVEGCRLGKS